MNKVKKIVSLLILAAMISAIPGAGMLGGMVAWAFEATVVDATMLEEGTTVEEEVYDINWVEEYMYDDVFDMNWVEDYVYDIDYTDGYVYDTVEGFVYETVEGHLYYNFIDADIFGMVIGENTASVFGTIKETDVAPIIRNDRTMLPARFVAENLGATVEWDGEARVVTVKNDEVEIKLTIDSAVATVNGVEETLDSPAFIENDRTYTPVRFIAEKLGATVLWDDVLTMVQIMKPVEKPQYSEEEMAAIEAELAAKEAAENAEK